MLDQILYEVALEFHTNDFTIFLYNKSLCMPSYWIAAWTGLQVKTSLRMDLWFRYLFKLKSEIGNVVPKKLLCFLSLFKT